MTDRRRASEPQDRSGEEHNPFAPPPEGAPDRPWQPRHLTGEDRDGAQGDGQGGGENRGENGTKDRERESQRQRWGSQWSSRQPRRGSGRWGEPSGGGQDGGPGSGVGGPGRWDPSDPAQRHARYAMLAGMWGVLTAALGWEWLALLLGSLALYWGISALRGGPKESPEARDRRVAALQGGQGGAPAPGPEGQRGPGQSAARTASSSGRASAISGVVLAGVALLLVAASYTMQLVYKDYFDCVDDALTTPSRESCENLLPSQLRPYFGERD